MTIVTLDNLEEGDYVHYEDTGGVYEVVNVDADFDENGIPRGSVTFREGSDTFPEDAETVHQDLNEGRLATVNESVVKNAEEILIAFAKDEIENYQSRLGIDHDYNGIEHVKTIRDIKAAAFLHQQDDE
jgi:hypothetical protein